ncbi:MAG TPA: hypothetical protein VJB14_02130 [Planctomycetota bacterium]|nr:hypothetical protein [Planctomycetota bacterium]
MMGLLIVLAALQGASDDFARRVEALGDEEVARREEAWDALRKAGLPALPAVEKACASPDRDVADLARRLARAIRDDVQRGKVLGPAKRVTLDVKDRLFSEVLREIDRQAGFTMRIDPGVEDRPVTMGLRDCLYFEAVDRLCEAHGATHLESTNAWKAGVRTPGEDDSQILSIRAGSSAGKPTTYHGPFRLRLESITLHHPARTRLGYSVVWQPNVQPSVSGTLLVDEAVDDLGTDLLTLEERGDALKIRQGPPSTSRSLWSEGFRHFKPLPADDATKLVRLRGGARVQFPLEEPVFDFDPVRDVGARRECGDFVLEFLEYAVKEGGATAKVAFTRRDREKTRFYLHCSMRLLDSEGKDLYSTGSGGSYGEGRSVYDKTVRFPPARAPATLRVRTLVRAFAEEIPFDFRDVPLPQW